MLFYKVLILFWGVLEHALMLGGSQIALFFTKFTLLQYLSPQTDRNGSISSGFDEGPLSEKWNVLWLVSCPSALWLANSLDGVSVLPRPLPKQQVHLYCHIRPWEYWTKGLCRTFACMHIARHIKVVMLFLLFFWAKSHFRWDVNSSLKITALTMYR